MSKLLSSLFAVLLLSIIYPIPVAQAEDYADISGVWEFNMVCKNAKSDQLKNSLTTVTKVTVTRNQKGEYEFKPFPLNFPNSTVKSFSATANGPFRLKQEYEIGQGSNSQSFDLDYSGDLSEDMRKIEKGRFRGYAGSGTFEATRLK